jgi:hypothetical protein
MKKRIFLTDLRNYFANDLQMEPQHCLYSCKTAFNQLNEEIGTDILDLVYLIFENRPIDELHTHSYGFHTRNGRHVIDTFKEYYNEAYYNN